MTKDKIQMANKNENMLNSLIIEIQSKITIKYYHISTEKFNNTKC